MYRLLTIQVVVMNTKVAVSMNQVQCLEVKIKIKGNQQKGNLLKRNQTKEILQNNKLINTFKINLI